MFLIFFTSLSHLFTSSSSNSVGDLGDTFSNFYSSLYSVTSSDLHQINYLIHNHLEMN